MILVEAMRRRILRYHVQYKLSHYVCFYFFHSEIKINFYQALHQCIQKKKKKKPAKRRSPGCCKLKQNNFQSYSDLVD